MQVPITVLDDMDIAAMRPIRQGNPDGVNHYTPSPIAEGVWDYFANDVVGAIDVRVESAPAACTEPSTFDAFANIDLLLAHRLQVEETTF